MAEQDPWDRLALIARLRGAGVSRDVIPKWQTMIDAVEAVVAEARIAERKACIEDCKKVVKERSEAGYEIGFNAIMQCVDQIERRGKA